MSFQLSPTNRSQIVTTSDRFVVAVAGDFRGGQLHVQFSVDGVFVPQGNDGIYVFETAGLRSYDSNGEDIKLLWVGEAGVVDVVVENLNDNESTDGLLTSIGGQLFDALTLLDTVSLNTQATIDAVNTQGGDQNTKLQSLIDTYALIVAHSRMRVEPLGRPTVRRVVAAAASSAFTALTTTCRRASIVAVGADIRFEVSSGTPTASATTHLILEGERLDIHLPATPSIAATRNGSVTGSLEIMELEN